MSFADVIDADVRLGILQALEQDPQYSHNEYVLQEVLGRIGHGISRDRLRTHLAWLEEQGLVKTRIVAGVTVADITARGQDAALGRAQVPGVARPRPGV